MISRLRKVAWTLGFFSIVLTLAAPFGQYLIAQNGVEIYEVTSFVESEQAQIVASDYPEGYNHTPATLGDIYANGFTKAAGGRQIVLFPEEDRMFSPPEAPEIVFYSVDRGADEDTWPWNRKTVTLISSMTTLGSVVAALVLFGFLAVTQPNSKKG